MDLIGIYMNELNHHGILGMKWGIRRFQNKDGSLTPAGKIRQNQNYKKELSKLNESLRQNKEAEDYHNKRLKSKDISNEEKWDSEELLELIEMDNRELNRKIKDLPITISKEFLSKDDLAVVNEKENLRNDLRKSNDVMSYDKNYLGGLRKQILKNKSDPGGVFVNYNMLNKQIRSNNKEIKDLDDEIYRIINKKKQVI